MTQRKGLADVFAAMKLLKRHDVELIVMGSPNRAYGILSKPVPGFYLHEHPASP